MAKHFTDTDKWNDPWFLELPVHMKACWQYIEENCGGHGVARIHLPILNVHLKCNVTKEDIDLYFAAKAVWISNCEIWMPGYMPFQRPNIESSKSKSHQTMLNRWVQLALKHGIAPEFDEVFARYQFKLNLTVVDDRGSIDSRSTCNSNSNSNSDSNSNSKADFDAVVHANDVDTVFEQLLKLRCGFARTKQGQEWARSSGRFGESTWIALEAVGGLGCWYDQPPRESMHPVAVVGFKRAIAAALRANRRQHG